MNSKGSRIWKSNSFLLGLKEDKNPPISDPHEFIIFTWFAIQKEKKPHQLHVYMATVYLQSKYIDLV